MKTYIDIASFDKNKKPTAVEQPKQEAPIPVEIVLPEVPTEIKIVKVPEQEARKAENIEIVSVSLQEPEVEQPPAEEPKKKKKKKNH